MCRVVTFFKGGGGGGKGSFLGMLLSTWLSGVSPGISLAPPSLPLPKMARSVFVVGVIMCRIATLWKGGGGGRAGCSFFGMSLSTMLSGVSPGISLALPLLPLPKIARSVLVVWVIVRGCYLL